jgi:tRNA(Phe) wybutosine-synthesizing methylase Tyw3
MIFSQIALSKEYENIEVDQKGNLILTPDQYTMIADYIEELKAENARLQAKLDQAMEELEKAYNEKDINITDKAMTAAGIIALILILANQ